MSRAIFVPALVAAALMAGTANAADGKWLVVGSADLAFKNLSLGVGQNQSADLTTLKPNVTLAHGRFYSNLAYEATVAPGISSGIDSGAPMILNMSRADLLLTFGYRVTDSLNLFAGWLDGNIQAIQSGEKMFVLTDSGGYSYNAYVNDVKNIDYARKGPFAGLAYSIAFGNKGVLNLSAAYAAMHGTLDMTEVNAIDGVIVNPQASFQTQGFSYGMTWSGTIASSISYRVGINQTEYKSGAFSGTPTGVKERYSSFIIGVTNYF